MPPAAAAIGDVRMSDVAGASDGRMAGAGDVGGPGGSEAPANGGGCGGGGGGDDGGGEARPPKGGGGHQAKGGGPLPPPPPHFFLGDDNELHPTPTGLAAPRFPPSLRLPLAAGLTPPPPAPPTPPSPLPSWGRPLTPADYRDLHVPAAASVVIDMGSASVRAGFSSDWSPAGGPAFPRLDEPSRVARVRDEATGHRRFAIGAEAMAPATRGISRSPFDGNLPWGATTSERLLDGVLLHLGLAEVPALPHRVLMTEAPAVPNAIRGALAEVLFEAYGAPAVTYAVDGLLSYLYNCNTHRGGLAGRGAFAADAGGGGKLPPLTYGSPDALVVSAGHAASHVLPVAGGRFAASGAVRVDVGGAAVSSTFLRRVQLLHPEDGPSLRSDHAEALIAATAYVSADYEAELAALRDDPDVFDAAVRRVRLPRAAAAAAAAAGPSAEELARRAVARSENMKKMLAAKKAKRDAEKAAAAAAAAAAEADDDDNDSDGDGGGGGGARRRRGGRPRRAVVVDADAEDDDDDDEDVEMELEEEDVNMDDDDEGGGDNGDAEGKTRVKRSSLSPSGEGKAKGGRSGGGRGGGKGGGPPSRGTSPGPGSTPTPLPPVPYTEEEAAPLLAALAKATPLRRAVSLRHADEDAFFLYLAHRRLPPPGAVTDALAAAEAEVSEAAAALGAAKAASVTAAHERVVAEDALLATPDADLPAAELKVKRRLKMMRGAAAARARAAAEKAAVRAAAEEAAAATAARRAADPMAYATALRTEQTTLLARLKAAASAVAAGSDRRSSASRNRMRLLAVHSGGATPGGGGGDGPSGGNPSGDGGGGDGGGGGAGGGGVAGGGGASAGGDTTALPSGKRKRKSSAGGAGAPGPATAGGDDADDTFGANDEDWDVYQQLTSAGSSAAAAAAAAAANARLSELATELADMVATGELPSTHAAAAAPDDLRPPTGARTLYAPSPVGELRLSVDRVRAPEVLFRPPLLGVDQCGIAEAAALALAPPRAVSLYGGTLDGVRRAAGNLFLTGGPALLPGYARRLVTDMRCRLPAAWGADLVAGVTTAADPLRDAWRGGALWASRGGDAYAAAGVTRAMYDEVGPDYLVEHLTGNRWYATPD